MNLTLLDAELRRDEGVRYVRYLDSEGIPTTGVGNNLLANPLPAGWTYPLNDNQVNLLLNHGIQVALAGLDLHIPWWRGLDEVRQRVLANMAFNLGIAKIMGFNQTLAAVKNGNYAAAAADMKASAWFGQVGARAVRLCAAMQSGVMPTV